MRSIRSTCPVFLRIFNQLSPPICQSAVQFTSVCCMLLELVLVCYWVAVFPFQLWSGTRVHEIPFSLSSYAWSCSSKSSPVYRCSQTVSYKMKSIKLSRALLRTSHTAHGISAARKWCVSLRGKRVQWLDGNLQVSFRASEICSKRQHRESLMIRSLWYRENQTGQSSRLPFLGRNRKNWRRSWKLSKWVCGISVMC